MLQIQGLVEGLTPARGAGPDRLGGGYDEVAGLLDAALSELRLDCVALYAKCTQVGYRSALPFLASHPAALGPDSRPGALRRVIDHLHARGVRAGAIVQIHRYDATAWGDEAVWWRDDTAQPSSAVAAADRPEFRRRLRQALHELVTLFPDLDLIFLEGEPFTAEVLAGPLRSWLAAKGLSFESPGDDLTYDSEIARTTSALGVPLDATWSTEGLALGVDLTRAAMEVAEETFEDADWHGIRGLVYPADGPSARFTPVAAAGEPWWLVPRIETGRESAKSQARRRAARQHLLHVRQNGNRACAIVELDPSQSHAAAVEARELTSLAAEQLDGLLVSAQGVPQARVLRRLKDEGGLAS